MSTFWAVDWQWRKGCGLMLSSGIDSRGHGLPLLFCNPPNFYAILSINLQSFPDLQSRCNSNWLWQASQDCEQILQLLMDFLIRDGLQKRSQDCMNADWSAPTWCESSTIWRIVSESEGDGAIGTGICRMVMDCVENSWIASKLQDCALGTVRWNDCDCIMWSHCNFAVHWICMDWLQALAPTGALYDIASMLLQIKQQPTILRQWTRVAPGLQDCALGMARWDDCDRIVWLHCNQWVTVACRGTVRFPGFAWTGRQIVSQPFWVGCNSEMLNQWEILKYHV